MRTATVRKKVDIGVQRKMADELDEQLASIRRPAPLKARLNAMEDNDIPTAFDSPESSVIAGASYDPMTRTLICEVKRGPNVTKAYRYDGFPEEEWVAFVQSPSKGNFFSRRVRAIYSGKAL